MPMNDYYDFSKQLDIWEEDLKEYEQVVGVVACGDGLFAEVFSECLNEKIKICFN